MTSEEANDMQRTSESFALITMPVDRRSIVKLAWEAPFRESLLPIFLDEFRGYFRH